MNFHSENDSNRFDRERERKENHKPEIIQFDETKTDFFSCNSWRKLAEKVLKKVIFDAFPLRTRKCLLDLSEYVCSYIQNTK